MPTDQTVLDRPTNAPARDAGYTPTLVGEVEIGQPLPALSSVNRVTGQRYERALILVRLHTQPLGLLELELAGAELDAPTYAERIWQRFAPAILEHLVQDGQPAAVGLNAAGLIPVGTPSCLSLRQQFLRSAPFVTVVIATRDRADTLELCLDSLLSLDYPSYEIIVVDNAPATQATADLWGHKYATIGSVCYVREDRPGLSWARNRGLLEARGEIVAYTDDDAIVDRHWLTNLALGFSTRRRAGCVTGLVLASALDTPAQLWFEQFGGYSKGFRPRVFDIAKNRPDDPLFPFAAGKFGSGNNMAFQTSMLRRLGGFDPALGAGTLTGGGEDLAAFFQVIARGYTLVYRPDAIVHHTHRPSYNDLCRQMNGIGVGLTAYLTKCLLDEPRFLPHFVRKIPSGAYYALSPGSNKNVRKRQDYPRELTRIERIGMLQGPATYLKSRRQAARLTKRFGPLDVTSAAQPDPARSHPAQDHTPWVAASPDGAGSTSHPGTLRSLPTRLASHLRVPLFRNAYALMLSTGLVSALGMIYWVLAARHYRPEDVGRNAAMISAMMFLAGISQFGLANVLLRFLPTAGRATARIIGGAYLLNAAGSTLAALIFLLGLGLWAPGLRGLLTNPSAALWFVAATVGWGIFSQQDNVLTGIRQATWVPVENTLYALAKIALLLIVAGSVARYGIFVSWTVPAVVALLPVNLAIFGLLVRRHAQKTVDRAEPVTLRDMVAYVTANYLGMLFATASTMLIPLLVLQEAGARANAHFYQPWIIVYSFQLITWNMASSLVVEGSTEPAKLHTYTADALRQILRLSLPVVVILCVAAPYILRIFGGDYATAGAPVLRWLALAIIPGSVIALSLSVASVQRRLGQIIALEGAQCVLGLGLSAVFLHPYGIAGVGLAWLASRSLVALAVLLTQMRPITRAALSFGRFG